MSLLPPTYDEQRTQLLISPSPGAVQFQKGYLGAHGERAAIEGELQIKGAEQGQWDSAQVLTISLQTIESNPRQTIEISSSTLVLFSRVSSSSSSASSNAIPSTLPFSIPLTPDTPQCIHTARSSIRHHLVATLHPADPTAQPLAKSILVHTRRYTSPNRPLLQTRPRMIQRDHPVSIKIEVPRTTFRIGEPIPVYITIPPPDVNAIRDRGLRLRNIMAELVRVVSSGEGQLPRANDSPGASTASSIAPSFSMHQLADEKSDLTYSPRDSHSSSTEDGSHTILTRSGSSCRFHSSRPVQIRLLLYPRLSAMNSMDDDSSLSGSEQIENDNSDCTSITQSTLLHTVSFHLTVNTTFMLAASHTESVTRVNIPIVLLPNPAPLPEVDESVASAYRKKHDKPPARTVRHEDADVGENEAGPSALVGAPPPFEERDAPPPFFVSDPTASTSSRLPTFLESESDLWGHIPVFAPDDLSQASRPLGSTRYMLISGEGSDFGFSPGDQYDGISSSLDRSASPPPSMANASLDTDVTEFANLVSQPERALEALGLALEQPASEGVSVQPSSHTEALPPPPPLLDDPSDPPPSIDVEEFRRPPVPSLSREQSPSPSSLPAAPRPDPSGAAMPQNPSNTHAPPPYLQPSTEQSEPEEPVTRPPPYIDVLPETSR
ncbi:hypothetical protein JB92DRAFT_2823099 [Gautieria morchelliformis]|nr:hypothetical protein JB92DRAFT_2823099 [Gautieria morchelliformis]